MRRQFLDLLSDIGFIDKSQGPQVSFLVYAWCQRLASQNPFPCLRKLYEKFSTACREKMGDEHFHVKE
jgi:hypothetical protein